MEHTARLAVIEQKLEFSTTCRQLLETMLDMITRTLQNIEVDPLTRAYKITKPYEEACVDYMQFVGYEMEDGALVFRGGRLYIKKLAMAKVAIENKLQILKQEHKRSLGAIKKVVTAVVPKVNVLTTTNNFLQQIQSTLNSMNQYENEDLLKHALECIPLVTLEIRAMKRLRESQREIKSGSKLTEGPFSVALLHELVYWYKETFFSWVNSPECDFCDGATQAFNNDIRRVGNESCRVEIFKCKSCGELTDFVRYNDPATLLETREGRCGEWANCFVLLCRSLSLDTRFVMDTTDHVWCEVYDVCERRWVHVDPCEAAVDTPLMYESGWGKRIEYVIAYSRDDVQDVTWRYSSKHKEIRKRRHLCSERELTQALVALREAKQKHLSDARRKYLLKRTVQELAELLTERKPSDYEGRGRISGSEEWRKQRGECGSKKTYLASLACRRVSDAVLSRCKCVQTQYGGRRCRRRDAMAGRSVGDR